MSETKKQKRAIHERFEDLPITKEQWSMRFPVHVAARIQALCDLYPQLTRTQIITELLTSVLDDIDLHEIRTFISSRQNSRGKERS